MIVKHIVFWTLKPQAEGRTREENIPQMKRRLESMNGRIPGLLKLEVGVNISRSDASADIALYSEFESRAALETYQNHPVHVSVKEFVGSIRDQRFVVDYEV